MAAEFAAYAAQVTGALQTLLESTGVSVEPAVEFVSCEAPRHEHFVPKASLERHLRKCHGERRPRSVHDAAFYYGRSVGDLAAPLEHGGSDLVEGEAENGEKDGELQSLLEPEPSSNEEEGLIAAITKSATTAGDFYDQVRQWKCIPRAFAAMNDSERELVTSASLKRWLNSELKRPGILPNDDPLDEELVEYVAGLLDHPDFCQPDLLALELHEFLGGSATKLDSSGVYNAIQASSGSKSDQSSAQKSFSKTVPTKSSAIDESAERDYKRRRASYRGKIGTKTGPAAFREMIQKHMVGLSLETDRELVLGGGFQEEHDDNKSREDNSRPDSVNWRNYTDALEVRNRNRPGGRGRRPSSRSRTRDKAGEADCARHRHRRDGSYGDCGRRSPKRDRWRSRSRSRSPRRLDRRHPERSRSQRRRSSSVDHARRESRRSGYRR